MKNKNDMESVQKIAIYDKKPQNLNPIKNNEIKIYQVAKINNSTNLTQKPDIYEKKINKDFVEADVISGKEKNSDINSPNLDKNLLKKLFENYESINKISVDISYNNLLWNGKIWA